MSGSRPGGGPSERQIWERPALWTAVVWEEKRRCKREEKGMRRRYRKGVLCWCVCVCVVERMKGSFGSGGFFFLGGALWLAGNWLGALRSLELANLVSVSVILGGGLVVTGTCLTRYLTGRYWRWPLRVVLSGATGPSAPQRRMTFSGVFSCVDHWRAVIDCNSPCFRGSNPRHPWPGLELLHIANKTNKDGGSGLNCGIHFQSRFDYFASLSICYRGYSAF